MKSYEDKTPAPLSPPTPSVSLLQNASGYNIDAKVTDQCNTKSQTTRTE